MVNSWEPWSLTWLQKFLGQEAKALGSGGGQGRPLGGRGTGGKGGRRKEETWGVGRGKAEKNVGARSGGGNLKGRRGFWMLSPGSTWAGRRCHGEGLRFSSVSPSSGLLGGLVGGVIYEAHATHVPEARRLSRPWGTRGTEPQFRDRSRSAHFNVNYESQVTAVC